MSEIKERGHRKRVLFVAEAVTLAHVARMAALANALPAERYAVTLATDPRYNHLLGALPYRLEEIETIPGERFFEALQSGSPIYDADTLERYFADDTRLLGSFRPDLVVGDFRLSLDVSAKLARVPYATVTNAYWSPYAAVRFPVPELPITKIFGVGLAQHLFDLFRPLVSRQHARPINRLRQRHGLEPLVLDTRVAYTHADYTLYSDLPELVPVAAHPPNHRFIGPVLWSPSIGLPAWWNALPLDRPAAYVTLGSSGHADALPEVLEALSDLRVSAMVATGGKALMLPPIQNSWFADYLPGEQAAARATVVICNGGSPTCYQALAAGIPIVGIPANLDQYLNMSLVQQGGAGILVRSGKASAASLRSAVERVIGTSSYRQRAAALQQAILACPAGQSFTSFVDALPAHA